MNDRFLATSTVSRKPSGAGGLSLPSEVDERLGTPKRLAWFIDEDTDLVYVVPNSEVTVR